MYIYICIYIYIVAVILVLVLVVVGSASRSRSRTASRSRFFREMHIIIQGTLSALDRLSEDSVGFIQVLGLVIKSTILGKCR